MDLTKEGKDTSKRGQYTEDRAQMRVSVDRTYDRGRVQKQIEWLGEHAPMLRSLPRRPPGAFLPPGPPGGPGHGGEAEGGGCAGRGLGRRVVHADGLARVVEAVGAVPDAARFGGAPHRLLRGQRL